MNLAEQLRQAAKAGTTIPEALKARITESLQQQAATGNAIFRHDRITELQEKYWPECPSTHACEQALRAWLASEGLQVEKNVTYDARQEESLDGFKVTWEIR